MTNIDERQYNITLGEALDGLMYGLYDKLECCTYQKHCYLSYVDCKFIWYSKVNGSFESQLGINNFGIALFREYKREPKLITWYEADKVYFPDRDIIVEFEVIGKSKEKVISFIESDYLFTDFEVLSWKEKQLPENPKEWEHD